MLAINGAATSGKRPFHNHRGTLTRLCGVLTIFGVSCAFPVVSLSLENAQVSKQPEPAQQKQKAAWHPPHVTKVWTTTHKGRSFRVTQLPHCEHLETVIAYNPIGETLRQAQRRLNGASACTGSFHHPRSMALADFLQSNGSILSRARTNRHFLTIQENGRLGLVGDHMSIKRKSGISALSLGQRLVPLQKDGFSVAFMNRVTDRMAIGLNDNFIFIVQGKSDIWRLAHFMQHKLPCNVAVNSDGGHVVRGKAPVHLVFRWQNGEPPCPILARVAGKHAKAGG